MLRVFITGLGRIFRSRGTEEKKQEMGFFDHLEELRSTLIYCIGSFAAAMGFAFWFSKDIFALMRGPLERALAHRGVVTDTAADPVALIGGLASILLYGELPAGAASATGPAALAATAGDAMVVMKFMDVFHILMNIGLVGGIALSSPLVLYFASRFVAPALTPREKKGIVPFCVASLLLFVAGSLFSFFWLVPLSIEVMFHFVHMFGLKMPWLASDYYGFVTMLTLLVGLTFQFPLIVIVLQYLEVIQTGTLIRIWRQVLLGILVGSLVITPLGDPVSLSVLTGILFCLYLMAVAVGGFLVRAKQKKRAAEEDEYERGYSRRIDDTSRAELPDNPDDTDPPGEDYDAYRSHDDEDADIPEGTDPDQDRDPYTSESDITGEGRRMNDDDTGDTAGDAGTGSDSPPPKKPKGDLDVIE